MNRKDRIAELETEVAKLKDEIDLIDRADKLEAELAELKRKLAGRHPALPIVPTLPIVWNGWRCGCGAWVYPSTYHVCQRWQPTWVSTTSTTGGPQHTYTTNVPGAHIGGAVTGSAVVTALKNYQRKDDPPDDGVAAVVAS